MFHVKQRFMDGRKMFYDMDRFLRKKRKFKSEKRVTR